MDTLDVAASYATFAGSVHRRERILTIYTPHVVAKPLAENQPGVHNHDGRGAKVLPVTKIRVEELGVQGLPNPCQDTFTRKRIPLAPQ